MTGEPGGIYAITHRGRKWGEALRKVGEKELPVVTTYGGGHGSLEKCHILKINTPPHTHTLQYLNCLQVLFASKDS